MLPLDGVLPTRQTCSLKVVGLEETFAFVLVLAPLGNAVGKIYTLLKSDVEL